MAICVQSNSRAISASAAPTNSLEASVRKNLLNLVRSFSSSAPAIGAICQNIADVHVCVCVGVSVQILLTLFVSLASSVVAKQL